MAEVVVRDEGDIVIIGSDGQEIDNSRTAAEAARLTKLDLAYEREQKRNAAKPVRSAGTGVPRDWFDLLDLKEPYTITFVQGVGGKQALLGLGAEPATIDRTTYVELVASGSGGADVLRKYAFAVQAGEWAVLVEPCGIEALLRGDRTGEIPR